MWLHAQDTADAIIFLMDNKIKNDIFNISGNFETSNLEIFKKILSLINIDPNDYKKFVDFNVNRLGQDLRYSIDDSKLKSLGWNNKKIFDEELPSIVEHYNNHFIW